MPDITLPQLGETVTEGTITRWFKQIGDSVAEDEVLFEVSTDKVDSEVPSPVAGVLTEIRVPEGETVDVGEVIAVVGDSAGADTGAAPSEPESPPAAEATAPTADAPAEAAAPAAPEPVAAPPQAPPPPAAPSPAPPAPTSAPPAPAPAASTAGDGLLLSPVVRRLIAENNLDPAQLTGTGAGGRITRNDVLKAIDAGSGGASPAPAAPSPSSTPAPAPAAPPAVPVAPAAAPMVPAVVASGRSQAIPFNNIRLRTGEHMVASKATAPHVLTVVEVDYEGVERARSAAKAAFKAEEGFGLTYLPFIARAVIDALREYPHLNATVGDGELLVHADVNLAVAVDLDFQGLLAPVVKGADGQRLRGLARAVNDVAGRARSKQLVPDDLSGGTFTLTNMGSYGTFLVSAVINQPQVAILSTDGIKRKPVVVSDADGNEAIAVHSVGMLALSWDHRAFDGAYAAAFMAKVREIIETRDWAAELT